MNRKIYMCLIQSLPIPEEYKDSSKEHIGYKVFIQHDKRYESPLNGQQLYRVNKWISDPKTTYHTLHSLYDNKPYTTGFHIFPCAADATMWLQDNAHYYYVYSKALIVKCVKYKHVVAYGDQMVGTLKAKCVVAEHMYIVDK